MDSHAEAVDDILIDNLNFKLKNSSKYVVDRCSVSYFPSGSDTYSTSSGSKVIKFVLTGDQWLVPSTVTIQLQISNTAAAGLFLRPVSGVWSFFCRIRVLCQGQIVEYIDNFNRIQEMFSIFTSKHNRDNDDLTNFGFRYDDDANYYVHLTDLDATSFRSIHGQTNRIVLFKPLLGILDQEKYIPLRYAPLTFELELVGAATDCIIGQTAPFVAADTSITWSITNPILKCDVCTLDNAVDNQIADHILSGKPLPINYKTYIGQYQTLSTTTLNAHVAIARAVSRLNAIFISFNYGDSAATSTFRTNNLFLKDFNTFYHPMSIGTAEVNAAAYNSTLVKRIPQDAF